MIRLALALALVAGSATAQEGRTQQILDDAEELCTAETPEAILDIQAGAITAHDLDGDGEADDTVVDFNFIHCSLRPGLWSGTGGAPIHFVLNEETSKSWQGWGWQVVRHGPHIPSVILLNRHGSVCDDFGAAPCVQAITVSNGAFRTVLDPLSREDGP